MSYDSQIHHRKSIRLRDYDYSQAGAYFVSICAYHHKCIFGEVEQRAVLLNDLGGIVAECWDALPERFEDVELDMSVVMPTHFHGVILIGCNDKPPQSPPNLGELIRVFKSTSTVRANQLMEYPGRSLWQRNYYEHVIRGESELTCIRQYIVNNPIQWETDNENPEAEAVEIEMPWEA